MTWQTLGFDKIKKFFEPILKSGSFNHAYIFSGQDMIGKRTFAIELANLVCKFEAADINPDLLIISPAASESGQTIPIEEIRKVKNFVSLSPYLGTYKFVVIDDADLMTTEAQNALLKVLEEPSPSSIMILVSANPASFLPTINSRCQEIKFSSHPRDLIGEVLKHSNLSKTNAEFLGEFSNGRIGLIKKIVEEKSFDEVKNSVEELMHLVKVDLNERLTLAQKLTDDKNKRELPQKVLYWLLYSHMRRGEPKAHRILRGLLDLYETITQPQFNQRLALETFLISL